MVATSIFFEGRLISVPGSYTRVDTSGLAQVGLGAAGAVALLGTAEGGRPVTAISDVKDIIRINTPEGALTTFRSGNLREGGNMLFDPSRDEDISAGAQQYVAMKVNPATQSTATFANPQGDALVITSLDFGAFTEQISVEIADGTNQGNLVTIRFEDALETLDDIGGVALHTLQYTEPSGAGTRPGWDLMTLDVLTSGHRANGSRSDAGQDADVTVGINTILNIASANAGDTTQQVTVYGLVGGSPTAETVTLNGTTDVPTTTIFDAAGVFAVEVDAVTLGNITVSDTAPTVLLTITAGALSSGGQTSSAMFVGNAGLSLVLDAAGTENIWLVGLNSTGQTTIERIAMNGTTIVPTTVTNWVQIDFIVLGELPAARTLTITGTAVQTVNTAQTTVKKIVDFFNARQVANIALPTSPFGFTATLVTGQTGFLASDIDITVVTINIDNPVTGSVFADLFFVVDAINTQSGLVSAVKASGATGMAPGDTVLNNTTQATFLSGGIEGITTVTEWQAAFNLLKQIRVNTIVPLTGDPAIHALLVAHADFMAGPLGRSERDGLVGLQNAGLTTFPTKNEIKTQIVALNTRHVRACAQQIERFDTALERTTFPTYFQAVLGAGMQAGSTVGISLTHKVMNALALKQSNTWNPIDDAEELIRSGLFFAQDVEGIGRRWVRNITTHLQTDNIAFTEASVNEAVNFAAFNFRTALEIAVGKQGFSGTINATKSVANRILNELVDTEILVAFQALTLELNVDVLSVAVQMAPIIPINFVDTTVHLITIRQTA